MNETSKTPSTAASIIILPTPPTPPISTLTAKLEFAGKICAVTTAFVLPLSTSLTSVFFIVAIGLYFLAGNWREKIDFILHNRVALFLLAFFALFIIGVTYTMAPIKDALDMLRKYDKILFAALLLPLFREEAWRRYAINAFLCAIGVALFFSYLKYFGAFNYGANYGPVEVFKGHISFSFLMSFAAYLIALWLVDGYGDGDEEYLNKEKKNGKLLNGERATEQLNNKSGACPLQCFFCNCWGRCGKRLWLLVPLFLIICNIFFMATGRSGYFVFAGLLVLLFVQKIGWRGFLIALLSIAILLGGVFTFSNMFKGRMNEVVAEVRAYQQQSNAITSTGLRIDFVKNSIALIKARPVFGYGTGSFQREYANIKPTPVIQTHNPHNEYLHIGVQLGAIGILMLLLLFGAQLRYSYLLPDKKMRNIAQATIIAVIIGSFANSWLLDTTPGHCYAYFIALTFACLPHRRK